MVSSSLDSVVDCRVEKQGAAQIWEDAVPTKRVLVRNQSKTDDLKPLIFSLQSVLNCR